MRFMKSKEGTILKFLKGQNSSGNEIKKRKRLNAVN